MADSLTVGVSEWGRTIGVSRQRASQLVRELGIRVEGGRLDPVAATAIYRAKVRPRVRVSGRTNEAALAAPAELPEHVTYDEARRREAVARALMTERDAAVQAGELVLVADVRHTLGTRCVSAREHLMLMSSRLAPVLAAESTEAVIHGLLAAEHRRFLDLLAGVVEP